MLVKCIGVLVLFCRLVFVPSYSFSQAAGTPLAPTKPGSQDVEQELTKLTQEFAAGLLHSDIDALDRLLSDDFTWTHSVGAVQTRASYLDSLKSGNRRYELVEVQNVEVRGYVSAAITMGRLHVKVSNGGRPANDALFQYTFVWVRGQPGWQMVALHLSQVAQPGGPNPGR